MTPLDRLELFQSGPCVPSQLVEEYYGLKWPFQGELENDFQIWRKRLQRPKDCGEDRVSRYEIEAFLQQKRILPKRWMAAIFGMEPESIDKLIAKLDRLGLRPQRYLPYDGIVASELSEDIVPALSGLRFRTFGDHNSFCARLHAEIESALAVKIEPLFCKTSTEMQEYPRQFAKYFDCLTLEPLSVKHTVWLDFHKPLSLGPDRCSKLFYTSYRERLSPFCAGTREPDDLEVYEQYLANNILQ